MELKRKVIIHKHLFKNAGTTFDWSLKKNFGDGFFDHRDDKPMRKIGQPYLIQFLKDNPHIKALSSHHVWFRFQPDDEIELIPVYLIRHPIERIRSVYNFERMQDSYSLGATMAKKMNFKEYVEWRMRDDVPTTIRNFHTRHLSGVKTLAPLKEHHLKWALEEVEACPLIGIVDQYDQSMKLFEKELLKMGVKVDLRYKVQNSYQETKKIDIEDRSLKIIDELGDLADIVMEKNNYDLYLYNLLKDNFKYE